MASEADFSNKVVTIFKSLLLENPNYHELEIDEGVYILSDTTCLQQSNDYKLILGHSETDIAIYKKIGFNKKALNSTFIRFYNDHRANVDHFKIPFVILELKSGRLGSNAIQEKSLVANRIKSNFPFCAYYFLAQETNKMPETLLRQGKDFTRFFIEKSEFDDAKLKDIFAEVVKTHLDYLDTHGYF